jgi:hypothetical protein
MFYDNHGKLIDYTKVEAVEVNQAKKYVKEDDIVLELGARFGGVACATNKILKNKTLHYVVEPDKSVWEALETNKLANDCHFNIIKGTISRTPQRISGTSWATHTIPTDKSEIPNYPLPLVDFNVLIADCEGFLETFYNENKEFFKQLRLIIFEKDMPNRCNYDYLIQEFIKLGFKAERNSFHSVFIKE